MAGPSVFAKRKVLLSVLVLAAALRLAPVAFHRGEPAWVSTFDSRAYLELAQSLIERGTLVRFPPPDEARIVNPWPAEVFRTPGYPVILAAILAAGGNALAIVAAQIAIDLAAIVLCAYLGTRLFGPRAGLIASALLALDVGHIVYANTIMSDVPFAAVVISAVVLTARGSGTHGTPDRGTTSGTALLLAGLAVSCACAIRPIAALAGAPLAIFARWRGSSWRGVALLLAGSLLFPAGWMARNRAENGVLTVSNAGTFNLYLFAASKVKARGERITQAAAFDRIVDAAVEELKRRGPGDWAGALRAAGGWTFTTYRLATVAEAGRAVAEMTVAGERRMLFRVFASERGERSAGINQGRRELGHVLDYLATADRVEASLVVVQLLVNALIDLLAVIGLWRMIRQRRRAEAFLVAALVAYFLLGSITVGSARMRMPVSFLIDLAAGFGLTAFTRSGTPSRS